MNSKETIERFKELNKNNKLLCTQDELNDFLSCGVILEINKSYRTRSNEELKIKIIKTKINDFDINLQDVIINAEAFAEENKYKRIFCMTNKTFDDLKQKDCIIEKEDKFYYSFLQELWLVNII